MKFFIITAIFLTFSCNQKDHMPSKETAKPLPRIQAKTAGAEREVTQPNTLKDSAIYLTSNFNGYLRGDSSAEIRFIDKFPDTFNKFVRLYGYNDRLKPISYGPLTGEPGHIVDYIPRSVEREIYLAKLISIASQGEWQSDNVNFLQHKLHILFFEDSNAFLKHLANLSDNALEGFWFFYFDGPAADNQEKKENYKKVNAICQSDPRLTKALEASYQKVITKWQNK